jgi:hypothetical protein
MTAVIHRKEENIHVPRASPIHSKPFTARAVLFVARGSRWWSCRVRYVLCRRPVALPMLPTR